MHKVDNNKKKNLYKKWILFSNNIMAKYLKYKQMIKLMLYIFIYCSCINSAILMVVSSSNRCSFCFCCFSFFNLSMHAY